MTAKQIYAALKVQCNGRSDTYIGSQVGLAHGTISKLAGGYGVGLKAAEWLAGEDSKWQPLYVEAQTQMGISNKNKNGNRKKKKTNRLELLSPTMQRFVGYVS